jgi:hypothetical protein
LKGLSGAVVSFAVDHVSNEFEGDYEHKVDKTMKSFDSKDNVDGYNIKIISTKK